MHLPPLLLLGFGLLGVIAGRLLFERWFNHLSLYSLIWGTGLFFFELRLIEYIPIIGEVWLLLFYAWIAFIAGSSILIIARHAVNAPQVNTPAPALTPAMRQEQRWLLYFIALLSVIALYAVVHHWLLLINKFGSFTGVLLSGYKVYRSRIDDQIPGVIPYLDSFALAALFFAGLYCARIGRLKLWVLIPMLIIVAEDVAQAGRGKMLVAIILFFSSYFLGRMVYAPRITRSPLGGKMKRALTLGLVVAVFLVAAEFIRAYRGSNENFYGVSSSLNRFADVPFLTPSVYLYLSSHPGVFNAYWKAGGEVSPFPGSYTFAPIFRILARFDLADDVPFFQKFYNTPIYTNTGTYLRELHSDFGIAGIFIVPYVLGFICTWLWLRLKQRFSLLAFTWLVHLYMIVGFTYLYQATRVGHWAVSLIVALGVSGFINFLQYFQSISRRAIAE